MRWYGQLAVAGVLGLGAYFTSQNWPTVQGYLPAPVLKAISPLLPKSAQPQQTAGAPGAGAPGGAGRPGGGGPGGPGGGQAPTVEVLPVSAGVITEIAEAVGSTRAFESVVINAKISGIVEAVSFEEGSTVKAGQELIRIDSAERKADLEAAKATIAQEEAKRNELRTKLDRAQQLRRSGSGTEALVDDLTAQVKTSDSAIQSALARERASQARMNDVVIRAPFAGRVGIRQISVGTFLDSKTSITTLDDISRVRLDFQIPENLLARIKTGAAIKASSSAFGSRKFDGIVAVIDTRIDTVTRSVKLTAIVDNKDLSLRPGMFMNAWLEVTKRENALLVPEEALVGEGPLQIAFAVKDNKIERRVVKIGQREDGKVEITEGLALGEQIVVRGLQRVRGGMTVNARPLGSAPPAGPGGGGGGQRPPQQSSAPGASVGTAQAAPAGAAPRPAPVQ
ncbi:MAG: efflux RND transporter periplasmic adaptor subunit [Beijerinckiaceae bacterium]